MCGQRLLLLLLAAHSTAAVSVLVIGAAIVSLATVSRPICMKIRIEILEHTFLHVVRFQH